MNKSYSNNSEITISNKEMKEIFACMSIMKRYKNNPLEKSKFYYLGARKRVCNILKKDIDQYFKYWLHKRYKAKYSWNHWLKESTQDGPGLTKDEVKDSAYEVVDYVATHYDAEKGEFLNYFHAFLRFKWLKVCATYLYGNRSFTFFMAPKSLLKGLTKEEKNEYRKTFRTSLNAKQKYILCEYMLNAVNDEGNPFNEYLMALDSSNNNRFSGDYIYDDNENSEVNIDWLSLRKLIEQKGVSCKRDANLKELELSYIDYIRNCVEMANEPTNQEFVDFLKKTNAKVQRKDKDTTTSVKRALNKDLGCFGQPLEIFLKKKKKNPVAPKTRWNSNNEEMEQSLKHSKVTYED